jgi:beta-glucosidase
VGGAQVVQAARSPTDADRRVESLLAQMTLSEKIGLIAGRSGFDIPGLPRLGIPDLYVADSPFGVRAIGPSTLYAGGINLAATWNPGLAQRVGTQLGRDARARGRQYSLGPGVNIYRAPLNGRNFEYYGEDPFLGARIVVGFVNGVQSQGVSTTVKHFLGNNSEYARNSTDSRIDERTLREIYLPIFEAAVKEGKTGAVMGSYNLTNGLYMTENRHLIQDVVKGEWGFPGVYMSDWSAVHDAVAAANAGTDLEMPTPVFFNATTLAPAVAQGTLSSATIDDKVRRLLRNDFRFGWMETRGQPDASIPAYNLEGNAAALESAREGMVLLKNDRGVLPLDRTRVHSVAVIGPNGYPAVVLGGGSATIPTYHAVSALEGIANALGAGGGGSVQHARGIPSLARATLNTTFTTTSGGPPGITAEVWYGTDMAGPPAATRIDQHISLGGPLDMLSLARDDAGLEPQFNLGPEGPIFTRWTGFYKADTTGTYDFVVQQGGFTETGFRVFVDGHSVADRWKLSPAIVEPIAVPLDAGTHKVVFENRSVVSFGSPFVRLAIVKQGSWVDTAAVAIARRADAVVLAVGFDPQTESEGYDRTFHLPPGQDELIQRIAAANPRTVVVINSGGSVDMNTWADGVPGIVAAWYPGQEGGTALGEILFGDVNPSGHLPATFERRWEDNPVYASYYPDSGSNRITYKEGVFVGYRGYDNRNVSPRFPFGHGLSYTTFSYANLSVAPGAANAPSWVVSFDVTNTGKRAGAAVPQVYVHEMKSRVPRPAKELKGFTKMVLKPGETRRVRIPLDLRSLAYYDAPNSQWRADPGAYAIMVGRSSADIALTGQLALTSTLTAKP